MARLLSTISLKDADKLNSKGEIQSSTINNFLHKDLKSYIEEIISEYTGYTKGILMCMSRIYGEKVSLENNFSDIPNYLQVKGGTLLIELKVDTDLNVCISFEDLLTYNSKFKKADEFEIELLKEEMRPLFHLGKHNDLDVVAFIPVIDLKDCKSFMLLDSEWETSKYRLGNVPEIKLAKLSLESRELKHA